MTYRLIAISNFPASKILIIITCSISNPLRPTERLFIIILELRPNVIKAQRLSAGENSIILIPRIPMIAKDSSFPLPFKRVQFPVLRAYYLTINGSRTNLTTCRSLFTKECVLSWSLYVGFGRCGDPDKLFVYADQGEFDSIKEHLGPKKTYTQNIIYPELLPD